MDKDYLSVKEASDYLGLHPQTVYRKCRCGELPVRYFGGTIRIPRSELENEIWESRRLSSQTQPLEDNSHIPLPSFLNSMFWDVEFSKLRPDEPLVFERILEKGDLSAIRWLAKNFTQNKIKSFLNSRGEKRLSRKSYRFWLNVLGGNREYRNSTQNTKSTLGKDRWR